jgi:hypothetical protein
MKQRITIPQHMLESCVEIDFGKGFLVEINFTRENYCWTQGYEHVSLHYRVCFETLHLVEHFPKGPKKIRKHRHKPTWWVGA